MDNRLPQGWEECALGDILAIQNGYAFPSKEYEKYGVPLIRQSNLDGDKVSLDKCVYLDKKYLTERKESVLRKGDILVGMSGSIGKLCCYNLDKVGLQNQRTGKVVVNEKKADKRFVWHYLKTTERKLQSKGKGLGISNVSATDIENLEILLPPLLQQKRIADKLDVLLTKVKDAQSRLDKIPQIINRFRQSILAAACSGRLTTDWREENPNVEPTSKFVNDVQEERKAIYERQCAEASKNGLRKPKRPKNDFTAVVDDADGLPANWCVSCIEDISECLDHLRIPINKTERLSRQGTIPYYGANGQVGWINDFLFDEELVLVVEDETFIGREKPFSYIIRGKSWVNNHAHVLRPLGQMPVDYLNICLSYYDFTPLTSGTTGRRKLNQEALMGVRLWIAPLSEQQEIVHRVESLFRLADQIEVRYNKAKGQVDKLEQSILAKAFRGELVLQKG